jgi:hypothetical protein
MPPKNGGGSLAVQVPTFPYDVYDLERLGRVADLLVVPRDDGGDRPLRADPTA